MRTNSLQKRALGALCVVATSLFLLLCLANYGHGGFEDAVDPALHLRIAGWFVEVFGFGAYVMVLLPLVWGAICYFHERTPHLGRRALGTLLLACSLSLLAGVFSKDPGVWTGAIGGLAASLLAGVTGTASAALLKTLIVTGSLALFIVSFVWATDWCFRTLRRGPVPSLQSLRGRLETLPPSADLLDVPTDAERATAGTLFRADDEGLPASEERVLVAVDAPAQAERHDEPAYEPEYDAYEFDAAPAFTDSLHQAPPPPAPTQVAAGFTARERGARLHVRGPHGYDGVEFLPPSDELADVPAPAAPIVLDTSAALPAGFVDDEVAFDVDDAARHDETAAVFPGADDAEDDALPVVEALADEGAEEELPSYQETPEEPRVRSGIGYPGETTGDVVIVDEFFAVDVGPVAVPVSEPAVGGDGAASGDGYGRAARAVAESPEAPARATSEPAPVAESAPVRAPVEDAGDALVVDEVFETPGAFTVFDEIVPQPVALRAAARPEPAAEPVHEDEPDDAARGLAHIHEMYLDPLFHDSVDAVLDGGRASAMTLQRRFGIGHGRGLRLLQQMEEAGIVGAEDAAGARTVLVARETWERFLGTRTA